MNGSGSERVGPCYTGVQASATFRVLPPYRNTTAAPYQKLVFLCTENEYIRWLGNLPAYFVIQRDFVGGGVGGMLMHSVIKVCNLKW